MATYVCSDIHGQHALFIKMLEGIGFSESDTLYVDGDIIDRGPDNISLIQDIMRRKNVISILGNHELFMVDYQNDHPAGEMWTDVRNGGMKTLQEYNKLSAKEKEEILAYINAMYLQVELTVGKMMFLLSHSAFLPYEGSVKWRHVMDHEKVFRTVWYSPWRFWEYVHPRSYSTDGRFHVIGHVPVQSVPENQNPARAYVDFENRIANIDLGCARMADQYDTGGGKSLCCMCLDRFAAGDTDGAFTYFTG